MQQITLTLDLTPENLEKLKAFCQETAAAPAKKPSKKAAAAEKAAPVKAPAAPEVEAHAMAEAPVQAPASEPTAKPITKTDVRAVALKLSKAGKSDVLKEIFEKFGATKLSEVPEDRYADLMKELTAVNA